MAERKYILFFEDGDLEAVADVSDLVEEKVAAMIEYNEMVGRTFEYKTVDDGN